jgi:hypothetical protein
VPAQICASGAPCSWAPSARAGTDEIQITHIAKDLLRR